METVESIGDRQRLVRQRWGWTQDELARQAGIDAATVRRVELGTFEPGPETARRIANALLIRVEWLLTGAEPMTTLGSMTRDEQVRAQTGPGTAGLPGFVVIEGGPWYRDEAGAWQVDRNPNDFTAHDPPQCGICRHRLPSLPGHPQCRAFPEWIPRRIYAGDFDHSKPYQGDNGIRFEPVLEGV